MLTHPEQLKLLQLAPPLLQSLQNISQAHGWLKTSLLCLRLQGALAQALPVGLSPLAQLPGVSLEEAEKMSVERGYEGDKWLDRFVSGEAGKKGNVQTEEGDKGEKEVGQGLGEEAWEVARGWNRLEVVSAEFKGTSFASNGTALRPGGGRHLASIGRQHRS